MHKVTRFILLPVFLLIPLISSLHAAETDPQSVTAQMLAVEKKRVLDGVIEAVHQATVSAQVSGRVEKVFFDVNDYVKKGDVIIQFRDREVRAAFNAARASFEEADAEFKRVKDIFERKLVAKAALDKAEARYKSAKASLEQATEQLENTQVKAPYSGIVVKRLIESGELASVGRPLMAGLSLEALRVVVEVPQDIIDTVRRLNKAHIQFNAQNIEAAAITISPYADSKSHTFLVRVDLPKQDYGAYPGMMVKVGFVTGEEPRLVIPKKAVAQRSEVSAVYVKDAQGKLSFRQVRVGEYVPKVDGMEILSGLSEGETVLLDTVRAAAQLKSQE